MDRFDRERELRLLARERDGIARLAKMYQELAGQLPKVDASVSQLIKDIVRLESQQAAATPPG